MPCNTHKLSLTTENNTIDAVADFEIHPALMDIVVEVLLVDELLRDVGELDFDVFRIVEWRF